MLCDFLRQQDVKMSCPQEDLKGLDLKECLLFPGMFLCSPHGFKELIKKQEKEIKCGNGVLVMTFKSLGGLGTQYRYFKEQLLLYLYEH